MRRQTIFAISAFIFGCDTDQAPLGGVDPGAIGAPTGKSDGAPEATISGKNGFDVVRLSGDAATDLFGIMDRAGGLNRSRQGSLNYVYGDYTICVSNGTAAACELYADVATKDVGGYLATVHGPRFDSAASELFGSLARSQSINPASVQQIRANRFLCEKTAAEVWCGLEPGATDPVLELSFAGLPPLGPQFVYEGWLITADGPVTSGRFVINEGDSDVEMAVSAELAAASTMFVLTIEPKTGDDPAPSSTHVVAGVFADGTADLDTVHPAAIGSDFTEAAGGFILETPSTADIADDYKLGVWFLDPTAGPGPSLDLPKLPDGWVYEGWVASADGPISTGRFTDVAAPDSDRGGPTAGADPTPPFPGQDFISPPLVLPNGFSVVVSVEPEPDDSPAPFELKPLIAKITNEGPAKVQDLDNLANESRITGVATLR